jgi:hypothetical protein
LICAAATAAGVDPIGVAHADEISTIHSNARALGMGEAFTAVADDSSALFYNPAGLARVRGLNWKIFDLRVGASGLDAYNHIRDLSGSSGGSGYASQISGLYGDHVWSGAGAETAFTAPMFGIAAFDHADALVKIDNPVYPQAYTSVINDFGYVMGFGVPLSPFFQAGFDLKYIRRTGARVPFGASFLADLDPSRIKDNVTGWGKGYGADAGFNVVLPAPFFSATFSTVWRNIGQTHFRSSNPNAAEIPFDDNDITAGISLLFDTPVVSLRPSVDFRYINSTEYQLTRKINFGLEVGLPLLDIRGGFREGYYTYGFGVNLGLFRVDAASYGVELGAYPGQIEDRRYVVEFTMELGVGDFGAPGAGGGSGSSSASGGSRSSGSVWGGRGRLKQRR